MAQKDPKNYSLTRRPHRAVRNELRGDLTSFWHAGWTEDEAADRMAGFSDARNSFVPVWVSLPPFLMLEYFVELSIPSMPSALVFPVGFLLFWAFYFTFYKPNVLEDRLSDPTQWHLTFPPSLILGFALWFVKASFLEIRYLVYERGLRKLASTSASSRPVDPVVVQVIGGYPEEIAHALKILGIGAQKDVKWDEIHRRYRFLAKRLHPDVNKTGTQGRRFIEVDQAYRFLSRQKQIFS